MDSLKARDELAWFFQAVVDNLPTMVFVKDAEHLVFQLYNKAGAELVGLSQAELVGKTDHDFFPAEQAAFFNANDRRVLASGEVHAVEEPITTKAGERWLLTRKIPIKDAAGIPRYLLGVSLDITERRAAEERLRVALDDLVALEPMVVLGQVAKDAIDELTTCLDRGDPPSLARAKELAACIRAAAP
jgi:PAS domain S-box-containing protein